MESLLPNLAVALVTGLVTGITASVVVARLAKFEELRNEARRIVWGIDRMEHPSSLKPEVIERRNHSDLIYISSELFALKHKEAGEALAKLNQEINLTICYPPDSIQVMQTRSSDWQRVCRELKPERKVIFRVSWSL